MKKEMRCPVCGRKITHHVKTCPNCGTLLKDLSLLDTQKKVEEAGNRTKAQKEKLDHEINMVWKTAGKSMILMILTLLVLFASFFLLSYLALRNTIASENVLAASLITSFIGVVITAAITRTIIHHNMKDRRKS